MLSCVIWVSVGRGDALQTLSYAVHKETSPPVPARSGIVAHAQVYALFL